MAGRKPKNKNFISEESDGRLDWFDRDGYRELAKLDALALYIQVLVRQHVLYRLDAWKEPTWSTDDDRYKRLTEIVERECSLVFNNPIVTIQSFQAYGLNVSDFFHLAVFYAYPHGRTGIWLPTISELIEIFEQILLKVGEPTLRDDASVTALHSRYGASYLAKRNEIIEETFKRRAEWASNSEAGTRLDQIAAGVGQDFHILRVNPDAPKNLLNTEFFKWLAAWQTTEVSACPKPFPELSWNPRRTRGKSTRPCQISTESLVTYNVVAFIDLLICERLHGAEISPTVKAELLFPETEANFTRRSSSKKVRKPVPTKRVKAKSYYPNPIKLLETAESQALSLMDLYGSSSFILAADASEELLDAYRQGNGDERFVPSPQLVAELNRHFDSMR